MTAKKGAEDPCGSTGPAGCSLPKPALHERPLLTGDQADQLVGVFKVLANDTRLRLLHALVRAGELCVIDLAAGRQQPASAPGGPEHRRRQAGRPQHSLPNC